jgi:hypothetical protein
MCPINAAGSEIISEWTSIQEQGHLKARVDLMPFD